MGVDSWCYEVQSVGISSATTPMTTKTIKSIWTERITPEEITGEGTGDRIEAMVLPAPSPRSRTQRIREMAIIQRDGQDFRPRGDLGTRLCGSGGRSPPTMAGRPPCRRLYNRTPNPILCHSLGAPAQGCDQPDPPPHTFPPWGGAVG